MRVNSPKQTKASRANGSKSEGPKSPAGKKKASQNAIQHGVFSRQIVIEALGESKADFESTQKLLREYFQPSNNLEEMLVEVSSRTGGVANGYGTRKRWNCEIDSLAFQCGTTSGALTKLTS